MSPPQTLESFGYRARIKGDMILIAQYLDRKKQPKTEMQLPLADWPRNLGKHGNEPRAQYHVAFELLAEMRQRSFPDDPPVSPVYARQADEVRRVVNAAIEKAVAQGELTHE